MAEGLSPAEIHQMGPTTLGIVWNDGHRSVYEVRDLRLGCRCAACVEEFTGARRLDPESIPADVKPVQITPVGNYALQIVWTDGHQSGIYTFEHLRESCRCDQCR